jgi:integrase
MSIYPERKNGKVTGRFVVEVQRSKRIMKARVGTYAEAQVQEDDFKRLLALPQAANGTQGGASGITVGSLKERQRVRPATLLEALERCQEEIWRGRLHRQFQSSHVREIAKLIGGSRDIKRITTEDMDLVADALRSRGLKDVTINKYFSAARSVLKWCLKRQYIAGLPSMPHYDEDFGRIRWLTQEEETRIAALLRSYGQHIIADYVIVAIDTGMRRGEQLGLEPKQVEAGWVHLWKTKTNTPRSIPLSPRAESILEGRKTSGLFQELKTHTLRWYWDRARIEMGLAQDEHFVVHTLRHTCATRLVNDEGIDVFTVQKWMGHKDLTTTRQYCHINDASLARARDKIAARLAQAHKHQGLGESGGGGINRGGLQPPRASEGADRGAYEARDRAVGGGLQPPAEEAA